MSPSVPGSFVVGGDQPLVGSAKATWAQGRTQMNSDSEDSDEKDTEVLDYLTGNRET